VFPLRLADITRTVVFVTCACKLENVKRAARIPPKLRGT